MGTFFAVCTALTGITIGASIIIGANIIAGALDRRGPANKHRLAPPN